jgi:hypothetical protein
VILEENNTADASGSVEREGWKPLHTLATDIARSRSRIGSIDVHLSGIRLSFHGRFFDRFLNWRFAFTKAERVQPFALLDFKLLRKWQNGIEVDQDVVSFRMDGVLCNLAATRESISLLANIANRIESQPLS